MAEDDPLMRVDEVASRLRVSDETVRRLLRSGRLRGVRLGSTRMGWRIYKSSVELFLTGNKQLELPSDEAKKRLAA